MPGIRVERDRINWIRTFEEILFNPFDSTLDRLDAEALSITLTTHGAE